MWGRLPEKIGDSCYRWTCFSWWEKTCLTGVYPCHAWQIDCIGAPLGTVDGASLLLTLFQVTVFRVRFNQLIPATPLWPLKLICISLTMVCLLSQKPGQIGKVFCGPFLLPIVHKHFVLLCIGKASLNQLKKIIILPPWPHSGAHPLVRQFGYWIQLASVRNHISPPLPGLWPGWKGWEVISNFIF